MQFFERTPVENSWIGSVICTFGQIQKKKRKMAANNFSPSAKVTSGRTRRLQSRCRRWWVTAEVTSPVYFQRLKTKNLLGQRQWKISQQHYSVGRDSRLQPQTVRTQFFWQHWKWKGHFHAYQLIEEPSFQSSSLVTIFFAMTTLYTQCSAFVNFAKTHSIHPNLGNFILKKSCYSRINEWAYCETSTYGL